jgi:hypothetical protein
LITLVSFVVLASPVIQTPQREYDDYAKQFATAKAICGTILGGGGPVSQPSGSTFRCAPGGKFRLFTPSLDIHSDGNLTTTYFPIDHSYSEKPSEGGAAHFARLFGHRFAAPGQPRESVVSAHDSQYEGQPVRIFTFQLSGIDATEDLIVRKLDNRPIGLRQAGDQSTYTGRLVELQTNQSFAESSWLWQPPAGALKRN